MAVAFWLDFVHLAEESGHGAVRFVSSMARVVSAIAIIGGVSSSSCGASSSSFTASFTTSCELIAKLNDAVE